MTAYQREKQKEWREEMRQLWLTALLKGSAGDEHTSTSRQGAVRYLSRYIMQTFEMNGNPLSLLRLYLPEFQWRFHDDSGYFERDELYPKIVRTHEFFWHIHETGIVGCAQHGGRKIKETHFWENGGIKPSSDAEKFIALGAILIPRK